MGDRANIVVIDNDTDLTSNVGVFLYGHWSGYELPSTLKAGLARGKGRWNDSSYLARILFCEMVQGAEMDETGFGISTTLTDNEYPLLVVNAGNQTITEYPEDMYREHGFAKLAEYPSVAFAHYDGIWT